MECMQTVRGKCGQLNGTVRMDEGRVRVDVFLASEQRLRVGAIYMP